MSSFFSFFLTPVGLFVLAALDSSVLVFAPFANDVVLIALAARGGGLAWAYPLIATLGSSVGAATTFWLGWTIGDRGLDRLVPPRHLSKVRKRVKNTGAVALALPALIPPPFPLTPVVLASGALQVNTGRFFVAFAAMRLLRYSTEVALALSYGRRVLTWLRSEPFQVVIEVFIVIAAIGTIWSIVRVWRGTRGGPRRTKPAA